LENFSAQRATWLFVCQPEKLDERQKRELALIRQASPRAETAYGLAQAFMQMIWEHRGEPLDTWLSEVEASRLPELESFAKGIQRDKTAVFAGLTLPWSNGPLEGHVNRLKLIKRSMYGRAKLPLLRARVLHVEEKEPSRATIPLQSDVTPLTRRAGAQTEKADCGTSKPHDERRKQGGR
jgi:transposase